MSADESAGKPADAAGNYRRLRVAVLTRNFSPASGGAERYAIALVEQLAARHDITVFSQTCEHSWPGVSYKKIPLPFKRPRWLNQLWFACLSWGATRRGFDVVHSHENTWHANVQTVHVMPVRHNLFKGHVQDHGEDHGKGHGRDHGEGHSGDLAGPQVLQSPLKRAVRWLKVLTSPRLMVYLSLEHFRYRPQPGRQVVVTSKMLLDVFTQCFPGAAGVTSVITPGIHLPASCVSPQSQFEARRQLGLPQGVPCLLFVGNDFKKKGLQTLLDALLLLPQTTVLAVVGSAKQSGPFKNQAAASGLGSRVFFLGAMSDTAPAYQAATCVVHPTREDTFAMVVLEAMAHCLPVVVSNGTYCGIAAMLEHQKNAILLADPFDATELASATSSVLNDELYQQTLGIEARRFAENFDWVHIAVQQEAVYLDSFYNQTR